MFFFHVVLHMYFGHVEAWCRVGVEILAMYVGH